MSFILDALKKSESERHRQTGPVLMDVRIAPPRRRIPAWAWVIAGVLAVNLGVLSWTLWRSPSPHAAPQAAVVPPAAVIAPPAAAPAPPAAAPASILPPPTLPPSALPSATAPAAPPVSFPQVATAPVPFQPPTQGTLPATAAQNIDVASLPKVADMIASGIALPNLQLSWHVYDAAPQGRYVLLNGARLREGDFTADGVRVAAIAPTGVVLEWRGRQMFLNAGH